MLMLCVAVTFVDADAVASIGAEQLMEPSSSVGGLAHSHTQSEADTHLKDSVLAPKQYAAALHTLHATTAVILAYIPGIDAAVYAAGARLSVLQWTSNEDDATPAPTILPLAVMAALLASVLRATAKVAWDDRNTASTSAVSKKRYALLLGVPIVMWLRTMLNWLRSVTETLDSEKK